MVERRVNGWRATSEGSGSGGRRQGDDEGAATTELTLRLHTTTVLFRDVFHDREAEARAARVARTGTVDAVKALENARQVAARDPDAGVGHRQARAAVASFDLHA